MAKKVRLGGRTTPIKTKRKKHKIAFLRKPAIDMIERRASKIKARSSTKRARLPAPPKKPKTDLTGRTIEVGISIGGRTQTVSVPQSGRGSFEEGTETLVSSTIIHFILYEPETQRLYVQLTAAGEWRDYTYFNVSIRQFEAFRDAFSKGRHFNRNIRNTKLWGFKHRFVRGKAF